MNMDNKIDLSTVAGARAWCDQIRRDNPGQPFGDHWEPWGVYLGDTWGDPKFMGQPGELEMAAKAAEANRLAAPRT